jgi:RNA polymerase sigma factor for flagellar operon FliA
MMTNTLPTPPALLQFPATPATPEDVQALADDTRSAMVAKHLPLVRYVAGSMARHSGSTAVVDYDDLVGYGSEGLIEAVDTFNPAYGVKFSTWAVMHIRTTIQDALRTLDPLPRSLRSKSKEIERVSYDLANRQGCWPTEAEIATELNVPLPKLRQTLQEIHKVTVSLDASDDAGE